MTVLPFRNERDVERATPSVRSHLAAGGLMAYPTETIYGLGSHPNQDSLAALSRLKARESQKPFLILASTIEMARDWGVVFNEVATTLARRFWPGPLTLILGSTGRRLPDSLEGPTGGIAVRCTSLASVIKLIENLGHPITSTSANRSGHPPAYDVASIRNTFANESDLLILDGGTAANARPSTLVDCTGSVPQIVRDGVIPRAELQSILGNPVP